MAERTVQQNTISYSATHRLAKAVANGSLHWAEQSTITYIAAIWLARGVTYGTLQTSLG